MLRVAALEIGDPMSFGIGVKTYDSSRLHEALILASIAAGQKLQLTIGRNGSTPPSLMMLISPTCTPCSFFA